MPLHVPFPDAVPVRVKNTSGATAAAGDAGYIDGAGEFKTTTTSRLSSSWCAVLVGGANNADILVSPRGRIPNLKYAGTAPSAGHFLSLSATAGQAQRETAIRPEVMAVALAAGSGGTVDALLLTQRAFFPQSSSSALWRVDSGSDTLWTGTINGTPTATSVTVTTGTGALDCFKESSFANGSLCKPRLHNTTRGTYRRVTDVNTGTGVITTESTSDSWANTDALTIQSQTNTDTGGQRWVDLDGTTSFDALAVAVLTQLQGFGLGTSFGEGLHPFEAHSAGAWQAFYSTAGGSVIVATLVPLIGRTFCWQVDANGAAASTTVMLLLGTFRAAP